MSFGCSVTDVTTLVKVTWTTVQNCRKACGEYDGLTQQVRSLHSVLQTLKKEASNPNSLLHRPGDSCWAQLSPSLDGVRNILQSLDEIVSGYASINRKDRTLGQLWTRAKFGNKELDTLNDLRHKARFYTGSISTVLNVASVGSLSRIEHRLDTAGLEGLKPTIKDFAHRLAALEHQEGTVLTNYTNDDPAVWKALRRELVQKRVVPGEIIGRNKELIANFIRGLGQQGVLDNGQPDDRERESATDNAADAKDEVAMNAFPGGDGSKSPNLRTRSKGKGKDTKGKPLDHDKADRPKQYRRTRKSERRLFSANSSSDDENSDVETPAEYYFPPYMRSPSASDNENSNIKEKRPATRESERNHAAWRISHSETDESVWEVSEVPPDSPRSSVGAVQSIDSDVAARLDDFNDSSSDRSEAPCDPWEGYYVSGESAQGYEQSESRSTTNIAPQSGFSEGKVSSDTDMLTSENLLKFEIAHTMAKSLTTDLLSAPAKNYCKLKDSIAVEWRVYYLSTPWGLCLFVDDLNLSLMLGHLKIFFTTIHYCLEKTESRASSEAEALKNGEPQFELQQVLEDLYCLREEVYADLIQEYLFVNPHSPKPSVSFSLSVVYSLCDKILTMTSSRMDSNSESLIADVHWLESVYHLEFKLSKWIGKCLDEYSDIIRFALEQRAKQNLCREEIESWLERHEEIE